jgi:hypothetical protein
MKMSKISAVLPAIFTGLVLSMSSPTRMAQADALSGNAPGFYAGVLGGANIPNGDSDSSVSPTIGATLGAKLAPQFGIGAFGTYYGQSNSGRFLGFSAGTSTRTFNVAGEASFFASYFHLGADVGAAFTSASGNIGSASVGTSSNTLIYGPQAGFDIPIAATGLSIGAEAHYLFNHEDNSNNNLPVLGAVKIWL